MSLGKLIPPLALFFFAALLTGYSYARISTERDMAYQGIEIQNEKQRYIIQQGGNCIGTLSTARVVQVEGEQIELDGTMYSQPPATVKGTFSFNDLGQLVTLLVTLKGEGGNFTMGTFGISPIHLVMKGLIGEKPLRFEFDLPGPILLRHKKNSIIVSQPRGSIFTNVDQSKQALSRLELKILSDELGKGCIEQKAPTIPGDIFDFLAPLNSMISEGGLKW